MSVVLPLLSLPQVDGLDDCGAGYTEIYDSATCNEAAQALSKQPRYSDLSEKLVSGFVCVEGRDEMCQRPRRT